MLLRSDWLLSMDLWLDENNECVSELSAFLLRRQCSSRFWLAEIDSESASILSWSKFWRTAWMMRIFYWRLMKKELWFLMDRKIGYSEWGGLIKDVTDASDWSKRFNFYISGLLPIFSEFSRFSWFSELKKNAIRRRFVVGRFSSSTGNFHQNQSELLSIDQKERFEFKQLVFFHFIL